VELSVSAHSEDKTQVEKILEGINFLSRMNFDFLSADLREEGWDCG